MAPRPRVLYQSMAIPPPGALLAVAIFESTWHQTWSQPVRQRRDPRLVTALAASGASFSPAPPFEESILESKWHFPWSEPVRLKRGLGARYQQALTIDPITFPTRSGIPWYANFSEPVRLKKGLRAHLHKTTSLDFPVLPLPALLLQGWYNWLGIPVWGPNGLKKHLQQTLAYHPRMLPNPDVTAVMAATETNNDVALFAISVYDSAGTVTSGAGARVAIIEVTPSGTGPTSITEA